MTFGTRITPDYVLPWENAATDLVQLQTTRALHPLSPNSGTYLAPTRRVPGLHHTLPPTPFLSPPNDENIQEEKEDHQAVTDGMRPLSLKEKYVSTLTSSHPSLLIASFSYIHALQVGCHAKDGIGTPCQNCIKANRACEWPLTPGQDPATIRRSKGSRSCASW